MNEYISLYGEIHWSLTYYKKSVSPINKYIISILGDKKLSDINTRYLETLYQRMEKTPEQVLPITQKANKRIAPSTIRDFHKLLRSAFNQAIKWDLIDKNPAQHASVPKYKSKKKVVWTPEEFMKVMETCEDKRLFLAANLAFSTTLRTGELLGLTWDCVDISEEAIEANSAYVYVDKQVTRVSKEAFDKLNGKDVLFVFPGTRKTNKTLRVLKATKTEKSERKVYLPKSVAHMMIDWKKEQDELKIILGDEYSDYNLVFATSSGLPPGEGVFLKSLNKLSEKYGFEKADFHSVRHTSISSKLKTSGGDIKSVQGDSGHTQAKMITDTYAHVNDEDRRKNAEVFEDVFYTKKNLDSQIIKSDSEKKVLTIPDGVDAELLAKILANPELAALLISLAKTMK